MKEVSSTTSADNIVETNIRIVRPGLGLWIAVRYADIEGSLTTPKVLESACAKLQHRYGLAAVPLPGNTSSLIVASRDPLSLIELKEDDWSLTLTDSGRKTRLTLDGPFGVELMPLLIERAVLAQIERRTSRWAIVGSPRHWYERDPFIKRHGVKAYRRVALGTFFIDGVGIGVAADVETSFLTSQPLAWFFDATQSREEQARRRRLFDELAARQQGQGTLVYDNGRTHSTCYFANAPEGKTCANTPARARGKDYPSLLAYYREQNPKLPVNENTPVVYVSFRGIDNPQPVAADRVWLRVFNDSLPEALSGITQRTPNERRDYIQKFWKEIEPHPLGAVAPGFLSGFWRPEPRRIWRIQGPDLEFAQGRILHAPTAESSEEERNSYYRDRMELLEGGGCYDLPLAVRTVHCEYPTSIQEGAPGQLVQDVCKLISDWTGKTFSSNLEPYTEVRQGIEKLQQMGKYSLSSGTVLFVLNQEPSAYYEVSLGLSEWRPKRVTVSSLLKHYRYLKEGCMHKGQMSLPKGKQKWNRYVKMIALDVLQQIDGVPWRIPNAGPYDAQLVIDVGHDRRNYAMSLLVARASDKKPDFGIFSDVYFKIDHKHETINARILEDDIVKFFKQELKGKSSGSCQPLASLLVLRDGRLCGDEQGAIERARIRLIEEGLMTPDSRLDIVAFHKDSLKAIRLWEVTPEGEAVNISVGTAVAVHEKMAVLANTGRETLHQGTVEPVVIEANGHCPSLRDAVEAEHAASQLNWSSPTVAQRLGLPFKRTDEELKARAQQQIKHIR
ncbi:MAG TPA: hypothetical protein VD861_19905 [Pyrinomonadaceae bacterium]|nr:hypothetical protein [Pyrinomonadaceae bacterium]